ncbi:chemotaxis protein CheW [Sphingomonas yunnanensis]|uniref:chemotaxis protein CheW n=1 Tax=Sphingomonas yunnanensis TaxID=310400 RepID=UPI001CA72C5B|nr:chemotaxis protein CheW [Sphingomonas yunnanensis]MBY9063082.1 chemotaxis protein CheW [Sphingomonas yunnanensis]
MSAIAPVAAENDAADLAWDSRGNPEVLTFAVGGETFAVEAMLVREIVDPLPETRVPGALPLVDALVNVRGRIVPLVDLRAAFAMPPSAVTADRRIVVVELTLGVAASLLGLRADRAHEVVTLAEASSEDPPALGMRWPQAHVRRLVRWRDDVIVLPDLAAILAPALGVAVATD